MRPATVAASHKGMQRQPQREMAGVRAEFQPYHFAKISEVDIPSKLFSHFFYFRGVFLRKSPERGRFRLIFGRLSAAENGGGHWPPRRSRAILIG
jgi:hypothetical protein